VVVGSDFTIASGDWIWNANSWKSHGHKFSTSWLYNDPHVVANDDVNQLVMKRPCYKSGCMEVEEAQRHLNQKVSLKFSRAVDIHWDLYF
jgi:hypothetical protein